VRERDRKKEVDAHRRCSTSGQRTGRVGGMGGERGRGVRSARSGKLGASIKPDVSTTGLYARRELESVTFNWRSPRSPPARPRKLISFGARRPARGREPRASPKSVHYELPLRGKYRDKRRKEHLSPAAHA